MKIKVRKEKKLDEWRKQRCKRQDANEMKEKKVSLFLMAYQPLKVI